MIFWNDLIFDLRSFLEKWSLILIFDLWHNWSWSFIKIISQVILPISGPGGGDWEERDRTVDRYYVLILWNLKIWMWHYTFRRYELWYYETWKYGCEAAGNGRAERRCSSLVGQTGGRTHLVNGGGLAVGAFASLLWNLWWWKREWKTFAWRWFLLWGKLYTGCPMCSSTWVGLTLNWVFHPSCSAAQIAISPGRIRQTVEH